MWVVWLREGKMLATWMYKLHVINPICMNLGHNQGHETSQHMMKGFYAKLGLAQEDTHGHMMHACTPQEGNHAYKAHIHKITHLGLVQAVTKINDA